VEAIEAIMGRRSIRRYTDEPVTDEQLDTLLRAAMAAPSAGNQQPWHFVVLRSPESRAAVAAASPYAAMLPGAGVGIVVCGSDAGRYPHYWQQDCAAAVQNILVAAHAIGLGGVWLGFYPTDGRWQEAQRILGIPADVYPMAVLSIGHPAEAKEPAERYEAERVHIDRW
jgi:nitroreductase